MIVNLDNSAKSEIGKITGGGSSSLPTVLHGADIAEYCMNSDDYLSRVNVDNLIKFIETHNLDCTVDTSIDFAYNYIFGLYDYANECDHFRGILRFGYYECNGSFVVAIGADTVSVESDNLIEALIEAKTRIEESGQYAIQSISTTGICHVVNNDQKNLRVTLEELASIFTPYVEE